MNDTLASAVLGISGLTSFICFILVLVQMFQRGRAGLAITCIVLGLCCGLGGIVAFVYGWLRARDWNIANLMTVWTVAYAILFLAGIANPAPIRNVQRIFQP
jgi:hypothetical protein